MKIPQFLFVLLCFWLTYTLAFSQEIFKICKVNKTCVINEKPIPGTQIDQVRKGETVDVIGVEGCYYKVKYYKKTGYILDIFINDSELIEMIKAAKEKEIEDQKEREKAAKEKELADQKEREEAERKKDEEEKLKMKKEMAEKHLLITDSTLVLGVVSDSYASICEDVSSYCSCYSKHLDEGTIVVVSGTNLCKSSYRPEYYFEIFYKNKPYFIKKNSLKFSDSIDYFAEISSFTKEQTTTFRRKAKFTAAVAHSQTLNEALTFLKSCKTKGLAILEWHIYDESEYTEGTSFQIEYYNPTNKTIKYITTTLVGYNPVGDKVYNIRKQSYTCQVKSVGPIEPESSGSYSFDYVWFTDMVETAKIISITVQYMDGTIQAINNAEAIRFNKNLYNYLHDD